MNYVIIGATSAIARATARIWAVPGARFHLSGRDAGALAAIADDLVARGADAAQYHTCDLADKQCYQALVTDIEDTLGTIDVVLISHGSLPDQPVCEGSLEDTYVALATNGLSHVLLLTLLANTLEQQRSGTLAVITSVAGDRGRQSNYVYGSAKSLVSTFLSGLRNRLNGTGVTVIEIKPGFVDTPMTAEFDKGPLWASAESVASGIVKAIEKGRDLVYLPFFWRIIMLVIRLIPEPIFKRLNL